MSFNKIPDRFINTIVLAGLCLWSVSFYSFTISEFLLKYLGLFAVVLILFLSGNTSSGHQLRKQTPLLLLLFAGWLIGHSLYYELTAGGNYWFMLRHGGINGVLFILEAWGTWGLLFLVACALYLDRTINNISRLKWIPRAILTVGVVGGLLPFLFAGELFSGEKLTMLNNQYSMSALYLNAVIPLVLADFANTPYTRPLKKGFLGLLVVCGVTSVFLTTSRGGIITLFVALSLFAGASLIHRPSRKRIVCAVVGALLTVGLLGGLSINIKMDTFERMSDTSNVARLSGRYTQIWPEATRIISRKPLLGYSAGTYYHQSSQLNDNNFPNSHNTWLQIIHDAGIVGGFLLGWVLIEIIRRSWVLFYYQYHFNFYPLGLFCATTAVFFVHGIVESVPYGLLGFFVGFLLLCDTEAKSSPP